MELRLTKLNQSRTNESSLYHSGSQKDSIIETYIPAGHLIYKFNGNTPRKLSTGDNMGGLRRITEEITEWVLIRIRKMEIQLQSASERSYEYQMIAHPGTGYFLDSSFAERSWRTKHGSRKNVMLRT